MLVQTPHALRSPAVRTEVNAALTLVWQKRIRAVIPVIAEPCEPKDVPPTWSTLHYYDASRDYADALAGLLAAVGLPHPPATFQPAPAVVGPQAQAAISSVTPPQPAPVSPSPATPPLATPLPPTMSPPLTSRRAAPAGDETAAPTPMPSRAADVALPRRRRSTRLSPRAPLLASAAFVLVIASLSSFAALHSGHFPLFGATATPLPTTPRELPDHLSTVDMVSPAEGWAIGGGNLIHYANGAWQPQPSISGVTLFGLDMLSPTEGWAVGTAILHYTGGKWVRDSLPAGAADTTLVSVAMVSSREGWAVGQQGIYHYLNGAWTQINPVKVRDEFSSLYSGSVGGYSYSVGPNETVGGPIPNFVLDPASVSMASAGSGWVAGGAGTLLRYDGRSWIQVVTTVAANCYTPDGQQNFPCNVPQTITDADFTSVVMLSANEGWAVASYDYNRSPKSGATSIYHFSGGKWQSVSLSYQPVPNLQAVSFDPAKDDGWAVGENGVMLHFSGGKWTLAPNVTSQPLNSVYMLSATDGWAVGDGGTILHYTGGKWTVVHSN